MLFFFQVHKFHFLQYTAFYHSKRPLFQHLCDQDVPLGDASSPSTGWPLAPGGPMTLPSGAPLPPVSPAWSAAPLACVLSQPSKALLAPGLKTEGF